MKKLLALLVATAMLLMLLPAGVVSAAMTEGDYQYTVEDGEATITKYTGPGGDVVIPDTLGGYAVVKIGYEAFENCNTLFSVVILEGITKIVSYAFCNCVSLTTITFPKSLTSVGNDVFFGCTALSDVYYGATKVHKSQIAIEDENLYNATWHYTYLSEDPSDPCYFDYTISDNKATITAYTGLGGDVVIPSTLDNYPVVGIGQYRYFYYTSAGSLDGWSGAFESCTSLTSVTIPVSITEIDVSAFYDCTVLTDVYYGGTQYHRNRMSVHWSNECLNNAAWHYTYPSENPSDPIYFEYTVSDNGKATITAYTGPGGDIVIPDTLDGYPVATIGNVWVQGVEDSWYDGAFEKCAELTSVVIPEGVTRIDERAFCYCRELTSVIIPDSVVFIGKSAFEFCEKLIVVNIPAGVTAIEEDTFSYCTSLTTMAIPNSITLIDRRAFNECGNLTDVWYSGAKIDRALMVMETGNTSLASATWHYETIAENGHYYGGSCDADCDKCGEVREVPHVYSDTCDRECNVCFAIRKPPHNYAYVCDDECDTCGFLRKVTHTYNNNYDVDCNVCGDVRTVQYEIYAFAGNAVSPEVSGLAFRFDMAVDGLSANKQHEAIYGDATVTSNSDVGALKLVKMGVIVSNKRDILLKLEKVNDFTCIDIEAKYLMECNDDSATFAVRIIDIPQIGYDTIVSARPYCIYEDAESNLIVEYGEVQTATYNGTLAA